MMLRSCPREADVQALLERGQWPQACAPDLREHVSTCRSCRDLALVTTAFQRARSQAIGAAKPGSPGLLWWRAQLRRRNVAVERISKPILRAQIFAFVVNLVVVAVVAVWQARHGVAWLTWLQELAHSANSQWLSSILSSDHLHDLFSSGSNSLLGPLMLISAFSALAGCVVVYFASEKQ